MTLTKIKSAALENVIRIHGKTEERPTEVIDLNIKTNLMVSNSKGSKFIQKSLFILVLFFTGTFAILLFNVRKELQALKYQEQYIETKIATLMIKYEKVNSQLSRVRSHINYNKYYKPLTTSYKSEITSTINENNFKTYKNLSTTELLGLLDDLSNKIINQDNYSSSQIDITNTAKIQSSRSGNKIDVKNSNTNWSEETGIKNAKRLTRTILNINDENDNVTVQYTSKNFTNIELNSNSENGNNELGYDKKDNSTVGLWREHRTARIRRDERRGKIRTKNKRRPNRSRRRLGPLVATFIGGVPEQHITDKGIIGPWVKLTKNTSHYDFKKFHLVDDHKAIEITMNGLYMISTQIFYFGQHTNYSYWILLNSEGGSMTRRVIKCSAGLSASANEVSCNTNVVLPLRRGDRLHIQQQERDRLINLREGHSYVQLVLLSNESQRNEQIL